MTQLRLPIFGICDWNPYGAALLMTYILGSLTSGIESYRYCVPMTWIGLHYTDITSLKLPDVVKQPFTRLDASKIKALKEHPFVTHNDTFQKEIKEMESHQFKVELESVYCHGIEYFSTTYLRNKLLPYLLFVCYSNKLSSRFPTSYFFSS